MENFLAEVLGNRILITVDDGSDFIFSTEGDVEAITDRNCIIGNNSFHLQFDNCCKCTKEDGMWIVKTTKDVTLYISLLDKIR